mmetsp:Transcript_1321/g.4137  ORF Transcript_1321/g.4137 Transcript_1321/m.4137 type:complete len:207 (-) Transcript_1321:458-1078(-)
MPPRPSRTSTSWRRKQPRWKSARPPRTMRLPHPWTRGRKSSRPRRSLAQRLRHPPSVSCAMQQRACGPRQLLRPTCTQVQSWPHCWPGNEVQPRLALRHQRRLPRPPATERPPSIRRWCTAFSRWRRRSRRRWRRSSRRLTVACRQSLRRSPKLAARRTRHALRRRVLSPLSPVYLLASRCWRLQCLRVTVRHREPVRSLATWVTA